MYRELIVSLTENNKYVRPRFPADRKQLRNIEKELGNSFPNELVEMLLEMDGDGSLLLSAHDIYVVNYRFRTYYHALDHLLFVAENGCGDYYGYRVVDGATDPGGIVCWSYETNETRPAAENLVQLICLYYTDQI